MIERNVVFYAISDLDEDAPFDRIAALGPINGLREANWVVDVGDMKFGVIVDEIGTATTPSRLRFLRLRDDRPYVVGPDRRPALVQVTAEQKITEFTYVVVWPDKVVAAIAGRDAPSPRHLARYLRETSNQMIQVDNLYRSDVVEAIRSMKDRLRKVDLRIHTSEAVQLENDAQLSGFKGFFAAGRETEALVISISIGVGRKRRATLSEEVGDETVRLAGYGDILDQLEVTGRDDTGQRVLVKLKHQRLGHPIAFNADDEVDSIFELVAGAKSALTNAEGDDVFQRAARG